MGNAPKQGMRAPYVKSTEDGTPLAPRAISTRRRRVATNHVADPFERDALVQL